MNIRKRLVFTNTISGKRYAVADYYQNNVYLLSLENNFLPIRFVRIVSCDKVNKNYVME